MECPSCHEKCDEIYICQSCGMMFCDDCKSDGGIINALTMGMDEGVFGPPCPNKDGHGVSFTVDSKQSKEAGEIPTQGGSEIVEHDEEPESDTYYSGSGTSAPPSESGGLRRALMIVLTLIALAVFLDCFRNVGSHYQSSSLPNPILVATAAPPEPNYPIHKTINVNQSEWSEATTLNPDESFHYRPDEGNVWLDIRINQSKEFREFPLNDSRWKPKIFQGVIRSLQFRIAPRTSVQTATVQITIRKATDNNSDMYSATKPGPHWPSELTPTREELLPPPDYFPGSSVGDTIGPLEDVLFRIAPGWQVTPFTDNARPDFEAAHDPLGIRIRIFNPDSLVFVRFKVERIQNLNRPMANQQQSENKRGNATQMTQPSTQPGVQRYINPHQPSYYPTSPTGPSYYPSRRNR